MNTDSFPTIQCRAISEEEIRRYEEDGAAVVRNVLSADWIERMRNSIQRILEAPGPASVEYTPQGKSGRYYGDFFLWRRDPDFKAFMMDSPMPDLARQVMRASTVRFFYDQLLVKEPHTEEPTPWHQDLPYWPLKGSDIMSIWVPFDRATEKGGVVVYVKGSHKWGKMFAPSAFGKKTGFAEIYAKMGLEACPDIEAERDRYEILQWELEPGDVIIHHPLTLHYASGNFTGGRRRGLALRYLGDDAVYDDRPGTFVENPKVRALIPEVDFASDFKAGKPLDGEIFPQVWPR